MTKKRSTKSALISSVLALFLCVSMLVGTTFAWFTDSVSSANNKIVAGNLDIELYYQNSTTTENWTKSDDTTWVKVTEDSNIFKAGALWEPGYTEVVKFKIVNEGTLALKYQLGVYVAGETPSVNVYDEKFYLSDYINYSVINGNNTYTREQAVDAANKNGATALNADYNSGTKTLYVDDTTTTDAKENEAIVTMVVYMPEEVDNHANAKAGADTPTINLGIKLVATQVEAEEDSFGSGYDEDAWHDGFKVYTADDLQDAINNGKSVTLMNDIKLTESIVIPAVESTTYSARNAVTIDLNGKTITGTVGRDADGNRIHTLVNNGALILVNGTVTSTGENGGSAIYNEAGATLTIENVTVNGAPIVGTEKWPSYGINNYGNLTVNGATINTYHGGIATGGDGVTVINDATVDVGQSTMTKQTSWALYAFENGQLTVNNGVFKNTKDEQNKVYGGGYICATSTKTTVINGGIFDKTEGDNNGSGFYYKNENLTINGGTFDADPSKYVADGYKAVESNGKYIIVSNNIKDENVVGTPAELNSALTNASDAGSGDNTIVLSGDIDLTNTTWTPIRIDGYNGAGIVTIEGNGATIKGLTAPLFAGGFAGKSGIIIKNLTIADSNIVSTSGLGGGAFIDTADSMQVITLENCHLVNSTVNGERTGGLIGWCSGYAKLNDGPVKAYVTITNCSVVDSTVVGAGSAGAIAGHPGASDYTYTTIENCVVKNVDVKSNDTGSWRTGAIVGTANNGHVIINNVTVEDVTLTQNGVVATETLLYGRFVPAGTGTLVIDGTEVLANATSEGLQNALASGDADLYLPAGEYKMPSSGTTGDINITGTKDTVLDMTLGAYLDSAKVTIEGVTIKTSTGKVNGNGSDYAALYTPNVTYINCTFVGPMRVGRDGAKFINCTFTELGDDYVWTYGNDVTFEGCTFNTAGKAILIYSDGGNEVAKVTVKNCTFNSTTGAKAGAIANQNCAAIEIHNYGNGVNLVTEGNTYDSNFSGEWRIKTYETGRTKVFVNGTEYTTIAIDGKTMTIDGNKNVTVNN